MSVKTNLPVPEIEELNLSHSFKQFNQKNDNSNYLKKPPKLYAKHDISLNRSINSTTAHIISFKDSLTSNNYLLSPIYQRDKEKSYYEQCFEQISKIGEGSFGEVFKVKSLEDGQFYAIKKSKQFFRGEFYRQERLEEVKRYEQFSQHEHCVKLYKAWEQDERLFMQMELCKCSLEVYVAEKKGIPETMVWSILLDLLLALKSLHDKNLIHLDIKLDNILISYDNTCKLADFGLVIELNRENLHLATEGDSRYIAPELMQGEFTKAADIFSLGIAILELASNLDLPSNGILWQQLRCGVLPDVFFNLLSINLQSIITLMMAPDYKKRPTVDTLLINPKLKSMYQSRLRWAYARKIKNLVRHIIRYFNRKLNEFIKNFANKYYWLLEKLSLKTEINDEKSSLLHLDDSIIIHHDGRPNIENINYLKTEITGFVNSTPLNHHIHGFNNSRKYRKDHLVRSNLGFDSSEEDQTYESSTLSFDNSLESPTNYIGKKLFFKMEDSD